MVVFHFVLSDFGDKFQTYQWMYYLHIYEIIHGSIIWRYNIFPCYHRVKFCTTVSFHILRQESFVNVSIYHSNCSERHKCKVLSGYNFTYFAGEWNNISFVEFMLSLVFCPPPLLQESLPPPLPLLHCNNFPGLILHFTFTTGRNLKRTCMNTGRCRWPSFHDCSYVNNQSTIPYRYIPH